MQPLPMNELVKSQLDAAGFEVTLDTMDWNALLKVGREGVGEHSDINAINISRAVQDPFNALIRHVWTGAWAPKGANWGHFGEPGLQSTKLVSDILGEFRHDKTLGVADPAQRGDERGSGALIFVVHRS